MNPMLIGFPYVARPLEISTEAEAGDADWGPYNTRYMANCGGFILNLLPREEEIRESYP